MSDVEMTDPEPTLPAPTPATGRAAQRRRAAAARSRRWRAKNAALKRPVARVVDAAIVEALSFLVARAQRDGVNIDGREAEPWTLVELARVAALVLEREGYAPEVGMKAVAKRLKRREAHTRPDYVPSLELGPVDRIPETKAGPWRTAMATIIDILRPRSPSRS